MQNANRVKRSTAIFLAIYVTGMEMKKKKKNDSLALGREYSEGMKRKRMCEYENV